MPPIDIAARVIANARLSSDYSVLSLAAPDVGARTLPGQFVMVKPEGVTDPLLRRPFSVFEVLRDPQGVIIGISILNKKAGRSTRRLYDLEVGDVVSCLGPLGQPFKTVASPTRAWMVAGGVGLAPFATLAESLAASKTETTLFYGARGTKGRVTLPLEAELKALAAGDRAMVYACGPEPMLEAVAKLAAHYHQPSQVSVERVMGCGLGGCYSCVVPVKHGGENANLVRSCISGPVFDGAELVWE